MPLSTRAWNYARGGPATLVISTENEAFTGTRVTMRVTIGVRSHYRRARSVTPSLYRRVSPLSAHMRDTQATNGSSESNNAAVPGLCVTTQATIGVRSLIGTRVK